MKSQNRNSQLTEYFNNYGMIGRDRIILLIMIAFIISYVNMLAFIFTTTFVQKLIYYHQYRDSFGTKLVINEVNDIRNIDAVMLV